MSRPTSPRRGENIVMRESAFGEVTYRAKVSAETPKGRRVLSSTHSTLTAAREWRLETIARLKSDPRGLERAGRDTPTVAEALDRHLAAKAGRREVTLRGYRYAAARVSEHSLGRALKVDQVEVIDVESWVNDMLDKGLAQG